MTLCRRLRSSSCTSAIAARSCSSYWRRASTRYVTSPPYWNLRDYRAGQGELGLEATVEEYVGELVRVFQPPARVLRRRGRLANLGDSYAGGSSASTAPRR